MYVYRYGTVMTTELIGLRIENNNLDLSIENNDYCPP